MAPTMRVITTPAIRKTQVPARRKRRTVLDCRRRQGSLSRDESTVLLADEDDGIEIGQGPKLTQGEFNRPWAGPFCKSPRSNGDGDVAVCAISLAEGATNGQKPRAAYSSCCSVSSSRRTSSLLPAGGKARRSRSNIEKDCLPSAGLPVGKVIRNLTATLGLPPLGDCRDSTWPRGARHRSGCPPCPAALPGRRADRRTRGRPNRWLPGPGGAAR